MSLNYNLSQNIFRSIISLLGLLQLSVLICYAQPPHPAEMDSLESHAYENFSKQEWNPSFNDFKELITLNPYNAYYHHYAAVSAYNINNQTDALRYSKKAFKLGYRKGPNAFRAGSINLEKQQPDSALYWFEKAVTQDISVVNDLAELEKWSLISSRFPKHDLIKVIDIIKDPAPDRDGRWKQDLFVFARSMEWAHHDIFNTISREEWNRTVNELEANIPDLQDHEIITELSKLAVMIGDGHTLLVPPYEGEHQFHNYPVIYYLFKDGLFVQSASPEYEYLVGRKILKIGSKTVDELRHDIAAIFPHDNRMGIRWGYSTVLQIAEYLHALGISNHKDRVTIEYKSDTGETKEAVLQNPDPITPEKLLDLLYVNKGEDEWIQMNLQDETLPLWQQNSDIPYWFKPLEEHKAIYFGFNQIQNGDQPFTEFIEDLFKEADSTETEYLIIDLRTNEGGDLTMTTPLQKALIKHPKFSREGNLYVLIGRETFSAAGFFTGKLDTYLNPIFVGEPMGTKPNFIGESGGVFQLPNSGLFANASNLSWMGTFSFDKRSWIEPDVVIELSSTEYATNTDPIMNTVLSWIKQY